MQTRWKHSRGYQLTEGGSLGITMGHENGGSPYQTDVAVTAGETARIFRGADMIDEQFKLELSCDVPGCMSENTYVTPNAYEARRQARRDGWHYRHVSGETTTVTCGTCWAKGKP